MVHPVQSMVESIHAKGDCPRLQLDLTCEGIVCPDFVVEQWQESLVIDLDPNYPLNLEFTDESVTVDLSFAGYVHTCVFPFKAIYMVADRATAKGMMFEENLPESVRAKREAAKARTPAGMRAQGKRERPGGESRRRKRRKVETFETDLEVNPEAAPAKRALGLAAVAELETDADAETEVETEVETEAKKVKSTDEQDEQAERRRSVFRVIDGGK